jgi:hypothetical protein
MVALTFGAIFVDVFFSTHPEESFENEARIDLGSHGRRFALPGNIVGIGAAITRIAISGLLSAIATKFERRKASVLPDSFGGNLIGRDSNLDIRALRFRGCAKSECRGRRDILCARRSGAFVVRCPKTSKSSLTPCNGFKIGAVETERLPTGSNRPCWHRLNIDEGQAFLCLGSASGSFARVLQVSLL